MPIDKQDWNKSRYAKALKEGKETYQKRKEYLADFKLPMPEKEEVEDEEGVVQDPGNAVEEPDGGIGNFIGSGELVAPVEHKQYRYTSGFGWRWGRQHYGVDLAPLVPGASGYKILAAGDGVVIKAGAAIGFGQAIVLKHKDDLFTLYGHMPASSIQVKVGSVVKQGQHIADMGQEGGSKGIHLHFEIHTNYDKRYKGGGTIDPETLVDCKSGAANSAQFGIKATTFDIATPMQVEDSLEEIMHADYEDAGSPLSDEERMVELSYSAHYPYEGMSFEAERIRHSKSLTREVFLTKRIGWARTNDYKGLKALNKERFIHQNHYDGYEGNLYSPDAKRVFESLLLKTKKPYFEIISGFRFSNKGQLSPHEAGCAIDILVKDVDGVREIADCAWLLGIRSIAIGGDFEKSKGFVHLDIGPKGKDFMYDGMPIYGGPGKWEMK